MTETASPTLDATVLAALRDAVGGDDAFVADLVETYLADGAEQLGAIGMAVEADDATALVRPAHTLKSASYTVGAMRLGDLARSLEQHGRAGGPGLDGARAGAAAARVEWPLVEAALRSWLGGRA
jgi:HPt (histidine-containing phosphotransfer) domain-containing protein